MAFPEQHYLLAFGGPLFTLEEWSCTLRLGAPLQAVSRAQEESALEQCEAALRTFVGATLIGSQAKLGWVKLNRVNTEGRYVNEYTNVREVSPAVAGGGQAVVHPPQVSIVTTLHTAAGRGLASKGRMYLPQPNFLLLVDGRISAQDAAAASTRVATLIEALSAIPEISGVRVASRVRQGEIRRVTGVSTGRTLDTVRSRRASLPEDRSPIVVVQAGDGGGDF